MRFDLQKVFGDSIDHNNAQRDSSVGFSKSYFFECKSGRNSIKVAEKWT